MSLSNSAAESGVTTDLAEGAMTETVRARGPRTGRRAELSSDATNRSIALGNYQHEVRPDLGESLLRRAQALQAAGSEGQALELLQQLPETMPLQAMMMQAEILSQQGQFAQAEAVYTRLRAQVCDDPGLSFLERVRLLGLIALNSAWLHEQSSAWAEAIAGYGQAIAAMESLLPDPDVLPGLMMAYRQRARVHRQLGETELALYDLERSAGHQARLLTPSPETVLALVGDWFAQGQRQFELEQWHQAFRSFGQAHALVTSLSEPDRADWEGRIGIQLARCLEAEGEPEAALDRYDEALSRLNPMQQPRLCVLAGLLRTALALRQGQTDALAKFAGLQELLARLEAAGTPRSELAMPLLALAAICQDEAPEAALECYGAAIRSLEQGGRPETEAGLRLLIDAYRGRSSMLDELGQAPKAQASLHQARRLADQLADAGLQAELGLQAGLLLQSAQKPAQALEAFAQVQTLSSPSAEPDSLWFRATYFQAFLLATELSRPADALPLLESLDRACPHQVDYDLACIHTRLSQPVQALACLQRHLAGPSPLSRDEIEADPDLAALQADARWAALWA